MFYAAILNWGITKEYIVVDSVLYIYDLENEVSLDRALELPQQPYLEGGGKPPTLAKITLDYFNNMCAKACLTSPSQFKKDSYKTP